MQGLNMNKTRPLKTLGLHDCQLNTMGITPLTSYMAEINPAKLEELTFSFIGNVDTLAFGQMLRCNTHLKRLILK